MQHAKANVVAKIKELESRLYYEKIKLQGLETMHKRLFDQSCALQRLAMEIVTFCPLTM